MLLALDQFARIAGLPAQTAERVLDAAAAGKPWHGAQLRLVGGEHIDAESLPDSLRQQVWLDAARAAGIVLDAAADPRHRERVAAMTERYAVIAPILRTRKHSPERSIALAEVIANAAQHPFRHAGKVTKATLYKWLAGYESRGMQGLLPDVRADRGTRRVLITRAWDAAAAKHLEPDTVTEIVETLQRYIRSQWASGVHGWAQIVEYAELRLRDLCTQAGWPADHATCKLNRGVVEPYRDYKLIEIADHDAKAYFDNWLPRIQRDRGTLRPLDLVVGDVHPLDVLLRRPDGSDVYARAIAWHDVATNRVWMSLIMLAPREGVRREHVAQSFASMCAAWGLPKRLYLDNGAEYSWVEMLDGFAELALLTQQIETRLLQDDPDLRRIIRARPYNAPAKAIEGLFSVLEQSYLRQIPGWVGGQRMAKKTQNVGQAPAPYPGDFAAFHADLDSALEQYHKRAQHTLGDRSPNQVLADYIAAGWGRYAVHESALLLAFAEEDSKTPDRGVITVDGTRYYHDALLPYGRRLRVRVPRHDPRTVFVFDVGELICAATPDTRFGYLDQGGAAEQSRRAGALRRVIAERRKHCDRLDLRAERRHWNASQPDALEAPIVGEVEITGEVRAMLDASRAAQTAALDAEIAERRPTGGPRRLSQWLSEEEIRAARGDTPDEGDIG